MDIIFHKGKGYHAKKETKPPKQAKKDQLVIMEGKNDKDIRAVLSCKHVDILLDPHKNRTRRLLHQRDAGLNHILCTLAKKNDIAIGFSFHSILHAKDLALTLGNIAQNIQLCKKYKVPMIFGSFAESDKEQRNLNDIESLFKTLGAEGKDINRNLIKEILDKKIRTVQKGVLKEATDL